MGYEQLQFLKVREAWMELAQSAALPSTLAECLVVLAMQAEQHQDWAV